MLTIKRVLSGILYLGFFAARAGAEVKPVIGPDGLLALSDGAPLSSYQSDPGLISRYPAYPDNRIEMDEMTGYIASARKIRRRVPRLQALSVEEIAAYKGYSNGDFTDINGSLWSGRLPEREYLRATIMLLLSGMNKLPDYKGRVIRADFYLSKSGPPTAETLELRMEKYRSLKAEDKPLVIRAFWSASRPGKNYTLDTIGTCTALTLEIDSLTAKDVAIISTIKKEQEALFRPGTKFKVLSVGIPRSMPVTGCNALGYGYTVKLQELPQE